MAAPSGSTPNRGFPFPTPDDPVDVPRDIQALAVKLDTFAFLPVGAMLLWPSTNAPTGYLLMNGQTVPASTYPGLAAIFGQDGSGNVLIPDMRDVFPIGASATRALGSTGGEAAHALTAAESGVNGNGRIAGAATDTQGAHNHSTHMQASNSAVVGNWPGLPLYDDNGHQFDGWKYTDTQGAHSHNVSGGMTARNADAAHNNVPPYRAVNFIIRAG